jgi:uncharacterized RDD family membrane protein YckC
VFPAALAAKKSRFSTARQQLWALMEFFGKFVFLCDFFSSMPGMSGRPLGFGWPPASNRSQPAAQEGKSVLNKSLKVTADSFELFEEGAKEATNGTAAWKQEVNQRLAAHRTRRGEPRNEEEQRAAEQRRATSGRAAEAAARVAARYAKAPSYSEVLAGEARAAVRAAGAAAEAARHAQAAAQAVLAGLESGIATGPQESPVAPSHVAPPRWLDEPPTVTAQPQDTVRSGAQPRWDEPLPKPQQERDVWAEMRVHPHPSEYRADTGRERLNQYEKGYRERESFDEEGFDHSTGGPDFMSSAVVEPVQHLPANLIEFPRELVAARKARPRLAEGPFYDPAQESPQLNIFEVDPEVLAPPISMGPAVAPPEWASIELEQHPRQAFEERHEEQYYAAQPTLPEAEYASAGYADALKLPTEQFEVQQLEYAEQLVESAQAAPAVASAPAYRAMAELQVAGLSDRLLAAIVDGALVTLAFVAAAVVVIASTTHPPAGRMAMVAAVAGWMFFCMLYQYLFLSYAEEGTPGMRYARIALCTFEDENPTREQMRRRIPAQLMSILPGGLGAMWAMWDADHLGWHDHLTRTYQRKY